MMHVEGADARLVHDVFVAHASPDKPIAREFVAALEAGGASAFLDEADLSPGDVWDQAIPDYHAASKVTLVLVSRHTLDAWYQRDEIAAAIEWVRRNGRHRIMPVYLERVERVPYGLRIVRGLWALDAQGRAEAVRRVLRLLPGLDDVQVRVWSPQVPAANRFFAGREDVLARLAAAGADGPRRAGALTQAIAGMGGVGKTSVAAQFCHEQRDVADIVWWLRSETESTLLDDLAALAVEVGLPPAADGDRRSTATQLRGWLESTDRAWLLVFDNVEAMTTVEPFVPRRGRGQVLVTTRRQGGFARLGPMVAVDVFDGPTAVAFLVDRLAAARSPEATNVDGLARLAHRLGGLPLALEQAAAYLENSAVRDIAGYLAKLDDAAKDPFDEDRLVDYEATATTTWRVSLEAAAAKAPSAPAVLTLLGHLSPDPFPLDALIEAAGDVLATPLGGPAGCRTAVEQLTAFSLIRYEPGARSVKVHRLVQDATRRNAPPTAPTADDATVLLRSAAPAAASDPAAWPRWQALAPHIDHHLARAPQFEGETAAAFRWVLDRYATFRQHSGDLAAAPPLFEISLELTERLVGLDHPDTLTSRNNLAESYWSVGRYHDAIPLLERTLSEREGLLGVDHPDTLTSRHNLAVSYGSVGRYHDAIPLDERTLADYERVLGVDHPDTLTSRNNLAHSYWAVGRHQDAIPLHERTLADRERVLGVDHPDTLHSRNNLALSYWSAGRVDEAISLLERTLADRERVLGVDHPNTLTSRNNLAHSYGTVGRHHDAITLH
ncbi:MAG: FxSxx-COOH system tetratricopeptide repeat protein, partial [Acidimicrobiia bacterium]